MAYSFIYSGRLRGRHAYEYPREVRSAVPFTLPRAALCGHSSSRYHAEGRDLLKMGFRHANSERGSPSTPISMLADARVRKADC